MSKKAKFSLLQNRVEKLAEKFSEKPFCKPYSPRLSELPCPTPAWSKFFRLRHALNHAHNAGSEELRVFAVEPTLNSESSAKREYIVSSYEEFWFYYSRMKVTERHFYEVIEEGVACHLYFDLEFSKPHNQALNGDALTAQLVAYVCQKISKSFGIKCSKSNVLELDSTSEVKFSRHLIFHLPNAVFRCNYDVGNFVKKLCQESDGLFVAKNADGKEVSFVDCAVYSKNRNFRLFQSCKKGKDAVLVRSEHCRFDLSHKNPRLSCCIYHSGLKGKTPVKKQRKECGHGVDELTFYASLVANVKFQENFRILTCFTLEKPAQTLTSSEVISREDSENECKNSPFPALQNFVLSLVQNDGCHGFIMKWAFFPCSRTVVFYIGGNRFCGNIGRQHKSNHIYYVANLSTRTCHQKCHDPVCKASNYRSPPMTFPKHVSDSILDCDVDDDELESLANSLDETRQKDLNENEWGDISDSDLFDFVNALNA